MAMSITRLWPDTICRLDAILLIICPANTSDTAYKILYTQGFVENLPDLVTARQGHGCGYYVNKGNNKVLVLVILIILTMSHMHRSW